MSTRREFLGACIRTLSFFFPTSVFVMCDVGIKTQKALNRMGEGLERAFLWKSVELWVWNRLMDT